MGQLIGSALIGFVIPLLTPIGAAFAAEVEGVRLPDTVRLSDAGPDLVLNGAGVRKRLFFRVYVGALYLQRKQADAQAVLADAGPKRVAMHMLRDLGADQLLSALKEGLSDNHSRDQLAGFEAQIRQLEDVFNAVKAAKSGDVILLDYFPGSGTRVTVNRDDLGTVPGGAFNRALLRIWLGEKPVDGALKGAMLGG
jgi:long-chain acyl-CoA synthetase